MKKYLILVAVLLFTALPAQAASSIEDATVNLYCTLRADGRQYRTSGSGVFVGDRGIILTNAHVAQYFLLADNIKRVKGQCYVRTGSPARNAYTASVLYFPTAWIDENASAVKEKVVRGTGEHDFALLYVTGAVKRGTLPTSFPSIPLSSLVTEGESVTVAGYPTAMSTNSKTKLSQTSFSTEVESVRSFAPTSIFPDVFSVSAENSAGAGISGGPVLKSDNTIAGIIAVKSDSTLRAVTVAHMNATIAKQSGGSLIGLMLGDLDTRAKATIAEISGKQFAAIREGLLRKR